MTRDDVHPIVTEFRALQRLGAHREHELLWSPQAEQLHLVTIVSAVRGVGMEWVKTYDGRFRLGEVRVLKGLLAMKVGKEVRVRSVWPVGDMPEALHELVRVRHARRDADMMMAVADNIRAL